MRVNSKLIVNLNYLGHNFELLGRLCPNKKMIFMIKSNAYGHGLCEIFKYCFFELGHREFGVAGLGEAIVITKFLSDLKTKSKRLRLYVFSETNLHFSSSLNIESSLRYYQSDTRILPVLSSLRSLEVFLKSRELLGTPLVLKFNTGMNRLGLDPEEVDASADLIKEHNRSIDHLMTHFSCAYLPINQDTKMGKTLSQYECFTMLKKKLAGRDIPIHSSSCANSGATEQLFSLNETHIRPGLMLYGPSSLMKNKTLYWEKAKNISRFETLIISKRLLKARTKLGYGDYTLKKDTLVLILPLGYGDGIHTSYRTRTLFLKGESSESKGEIIGRVNMDMIFIGLSPEEEKNFDVGDKVHLWDHAPYSLNRVAKNFETTPYEILTSLTGRVPREYIRK